MSDTEESGLVQGARKAVTKFTKNITSSVSEAAITRLTQAGLEIGLDIDVQMMVDGIGAEATASILESKLHKVQALVQQPSRHRPPEDRSDE